MDVVTVVCIAILSWFQELIFTMDHMYIWGDISLFRFEVGLFFMGILIFAFRFWILELNAPDVPDSIPRLPFKGRKKIHDRK
jgi:hypothetical protein